jgi:GNAT superfamily N-acetyltransferase
MLKMIVEDAPQEKDVQQVVRELVRSNDERAEPENWQALSIFLRKADGELKGGLNAYTHWGWLFIRHLWLDSAIRSQGYGRALMHEAERVAISRGCTHAHLDTHSFQYRGFYESLGYEVFGTLEDYPSGHQRFFMRKLLDP